MKITELKLRELRGVMEHPDPFWEERLIMPLDVYPEFRERGADYSASLGDGRYAMRSVFLEIHTDEGAVGLSGPCGRMEAFIISTALAPLLVGRDAGAIELLWDVMYRAMIHGRKGETMMAISVVDCGLWDLKGKALGKPVYELLGGPTRTSFPAYASALGFSIEPEDAARRARAVRRRRLLRHKVVLPKRAVRRAARDTAQHRAGAGAARGGGRRRRHYARRLELVERPIRHTHGGRAGGLRDTLARRAGHGGQAAELRRHSARLADRHIRRRTRVHAMGVSADSREPRDGRSPAGYILVRRHQRDGEDMRARRRFDATSTR